jgi:hypothetical protein
MARTRRQVRRAPSRLILDSGAVIALARTDARARAYLARAIAIDATVEVPVVVIAGTVRGGPRDAPVNRVLKAVGTVASVREVHGRTAAAHCWPMRGPRRPWMPWWSPMQWQLEARTSPHERSR